jgi:phosphohistidine phosphatase
MSIMNKTLILVRHSKTINRDGSVNDFERSLTQEGKTDSLRMAKFLLESDIKPDLIITSAANRALETANIFAKVFNTTEKDIISTRKLYYCSAKTILDQIYGLPPAIGCVMVVAHNPGISDLSRGLSSGKTLCMDNTQVTLLKYDMEHWYQVDEQKPVSFNNHTPHEITL